MMPPLTRLTSIRRHGLYTNTHDKTIIRAPFNGTLGLRQVSPALCLHQLRNSNLTTIG